MPSRTHNNAGTDIMNTNFIHAALDKSPLLLIAKTLLLIMAFLVFSHVPCQGQGNEAPVQSSQRLSAIESKTNSAKDRLNALHQALASKEAFPASERAELVDATIAIARDRNEDSRLRADSIRIAGDVGMTLVHEKALTQEEIARRFSPMLDVAADETEPAKVRNNSIIALGNLRITEVIPVVRKVLTDKANFNRPEIARSACLVMAELGAPDAVQTVGAVLSQTTNSSVFGSAAYALGRANSSQALSVLLVNRSRLGDNLSVDNAVEAMQEQVFQALEHPTLQTQAAIKATRSLWRKEQKERYTPLLLEIIKSKSTSDGARQEALTRLLEDAATLPLDEEKQRLAAIVPLVEGDNVFTKQTSLINQKLAARVLPSTSIEPPATR